MSRLKIKLYRIFLLFKREVREGLKSLIIASAAASGFLFFLIISDAFSITGIDHNRLYLLFLSAGGFIYTSSCFREIHQRDKNSVYLLLPASVFEKFLQRLITVTLIWIFFSLTLYLISSYAAALFIKYIFKMQIPLFNPFVSAIFKAFPVYIINSSLFFLGAIYFKKTHFFKTLLSLFAFFILTAIITTVMARLIFSSEINTVFEYHFEKNLDSMRFSLLDYNLDSMISVIFKSLRLIYYALLAPLFWFVSYLRLKEVEVRNGI
ncbi:MAG: hypothetical protein RBT69_13275 [Spirochaetia bacterium]|jgi:hypothetical protein|nr:hypothetical protein [Spirochaetia bacterium]